MNNSISEKSKRRFFGFLTLKKVEIIEKTDACPHTTSIFKGQFNPWDLFQARFK